MIVRSYQETFGLNTVITNCSNNNGPKQHDEKVPKDSSYKELITFVEDRAGHDRRYAIDATKLESELGWRANENFKSGIIKTIEWHLEKYNG